MKFSGIFQSHPLGHGNKHYELGNHLGNVLADAERNRRGSIRLIG
jgi:hypothetical protein